MEYITYLKDTIYDDHLIHIETYLERIKNDKTAPDNINFFIKEAYNYFAGKSITNNIKIGMFGIYFPEVFIYALGAQPVWILGGSTVMGEAVDDYLPRDVDPVVRSSIGYANIEKMDLIKECNLFIVPMLSDSIKKAIPLFPKHANVHAFDVCHLLFDSKTSQWENEMRLTIEKLEDITGKKLTVDSLKKAATNINKANKVLLSLKKLYESGKISNEVYFFLRQSYYMTQNLPYWITEMESAINHYKKVDNEGKVKPFVALVGSHIYSPNDKIPTLLDNLGLIAKYMDIGLPLPNHYHGFESIQTKNDLVDLIENQDYKKTFGAHHVNPNSTYVPINEVCGIVFHLLKGQVNYAFMAEQLDRFATDNDISMITIETDFGKADLEQIKIRMEAFKEMLSHG
ncbi:2-hydroxyacyl-CoA dehydratase family protein [Oceanirhabdus seepicola]|uniref:2-hydroxyacyl-CoA dehydratase n=1 Tax=Oceanirhabdus seepicola TaxID=2828781 RepID=A0A9J6NWF4_9CLOT|nr:2-hydroxyacyl-CoA dehydratase family protein [Oceanirhabdus seepicola]MCM1988342.1 2-hydroxyacyl-CoA dehydratase [Oceanirhabdus seepicola]